MVPRTQQQQQKGSKLDPGLAITSQNNNPDYRSQPPFFSRQDMYAAEDNEYAYVEEFQFNSPPTCTCPRDTMPLDSNSVLPCSGGGCDPYGIPAPENAISDKQPNERHYEKSRPRVFSADVPPQYFVLDHPDLPNSSNGNCCDPPDGTIREDLMV